MYQYVDVIPAKVVFKIQNSQDISILSPYLIEGHTLEQAWQIIEDEHTDLAPDQKSNIDLYKSIEQLKAKYESIHLAIIYLSKLWDDDLADMLTSYGYVLTNSGYLNLEDMTENKEHQEAIEVIKNQSEGVLIKLNHQLSRLEKVKKTKKTKESTFEENILAYTSFTGVGYVNSNLITLTEFYALIALGQEKIKSLEKSSGKAKQNNQRKNSRQ